MRARLVMALLATALLLPFAPAATAAEASLSDATGDVQLATGVPGGSTAPPGGVGGAIDLAGLAFVEDPETFTLVLTVGNLAEQGDASGRYLVDFTWGSILYTAYVERFSSSFGGSFAWGYLGIRQEADMTDYWELDGVTMLTPVFDVTSNTITLPIPKPFLLDEQERPPVKGSSITDLRVRSERQFLFSGSINGERPLNLMDAMPDDGVASYTFVEGDEASGHLFMSSFERVRVSNGGATTFVFHATLRNTGETSDAVKITIEDLPEGWNGTVEPRVVVPAGEELSFPVIATVPFAHDHGGFTSFLVRATSETMADAYATLRLGVVHTAIPQPAGHHDELFLHGAIQDSGNPFSQFFPWAEMSMNTLDSHDGEPAAVNAYGTGGGYAWQIPLSPSLRMGLDFRMDEVGSIVGSILGRNVGDADVSARLALVPYYEGGWSGSVEDGILLAESDVQTITLDLQTATPFTLALTPTDAADYVAYMRGMNLLLEITMEPQSLSFPCCMPQTQPALETGSFKMTLPLDEYHDRVILTTPGDLSPISLIPVTTPQRVGRPGSLLTYEMELVNNADKEITLDLDLAGTHADAGDLAPEGPLTLAPSEKRVLTLGVRVPADAVDGELVEVLVFAHAVDDPSLSAIARTITTVASGAAAEADESAVFASAKEQSNDTPSVGVALVLAVAGASALFARRRS